MPNKKSQGPRRDSRTKKGEKNCNIPKRIFIYINMHWKIETESIELQAEERLSGSEAKEKPLLMWDRPPSPPCLPRRTDACPPPPPPPPTIWIWRCLTPSSQSSISQLKCKKPTHDLQRGAAMETTEATHLYMYRHTHTHTKQTNIHTNVHTYMQTSTQTLTHTKWWVTSERIGAAIVNFVLCKCDVLNSKPYYWIPFTSSSLCTYIPRRRFQIDSLICENWQQNMVIVICGVVISLFRFRFFESLRLRSKWMDYNLDFFSGVCFLPFTSSVLHWHYQILQHSYKLRLCYFFHKILENE